MRGKKGEDMMRGEEILGEGKLEKEREDGREKGEGKGA